MWDMRLFGQNLYYIFYVFILYGFIGWIYESALVSFKKKTFVNRGFLTGPIIPIYGCGALLFYLIFLDYKGQLLLVYFGSVLIATLLEYLTSWAMEQLFHTRWWDYSH